MAHSVVFPVEIIYEPDGHVGVIAALPNASRSAVIATTEPETGAFELPPLLFQLPPWQLGNYSLMHIAEAYAPFDDHPAGPEL